MAPKQEVAVPEKEEETLLRYSGELELPMGFHFSPREDVLIVNFLIPKLLGSQVPTSTMEDFDNVYTFDPKEILFNEIENELEKYLFSKQMFMLGSSGLWKVKKDGVEVKNKSNEIVGYKKTLIYDKGDKEDKFSWKLNEYRVNPNLMNPAYGATKYVACKLKFKNTSNVIDIEPCSDHSSDDDGGEDAN